MCASQEECKKRENGRKEKQEAEKEKRIKKMKRIEHSGWGRSSGKKVSEKKPGQKEDNAWK